MNAPARAWTCAFCGRHVPAHVDTCYCGSRRPIEAPAARPERRTGRLVAIAVAAAALVAITLSSLTRRRDDAQPVARTTAEDSIALPSSTDPAVTAPVADEVVAAARPALVLVESADGRGTGFFSATDAVTTTRDVLGHQKSATVTLGDGRRLDATVAAIADQPRLVQLHVNVTGAAVMTWLPPLPVRDTRAGAGLALLTWPDMTARGALKALRRQQGVAVVETTLVVHTEDEGAPVVDQSGRVAAVVSGHRAVYFDSARPYFHAAP